MLNRFTGSTVHRFTGVLFILSFVAMNEGRPETLRCAVGTGGRGVHSGARSLPAVTGGESGQLRGWSGERENVREKARWPEVQ